MKTIGERIRFLRNREKLTQKELGRRVGVSGPSVTQWESDQQVPRTDNAEKLAKALRSNWPWIRYGVGEPEQSTRKLELDKIQASAEVIDLHFLSEEELGNSGSSEKTMPFEVETLERKGINPATAILLAISDNALEPIIPAGSIVGVDKAASNIQDGHLYLINVGGWVRVRRLYRAPGDSIRISSFNKLEHPDATFPADAVSVIGKVFWYSVLL